MRKSLLIAPVFMISALSSFAIYAGQSAVDYVPGELLVKVADLKQEDAATQALNVNGAYDVQPLLRTTRMPINSPLARWRQVHFGQGVNLQKVIDRLSKNRLFERVQYNHVLKLAATPNDPQYSQQWGLPKINAPGAWDITTGSSGVVVGVIDTGISLAHPDLAANIWTNPGEIAGNGIDDDHNGYVDDVHGYDFGNNDADPTDYVGHGTHVAGTIAAVGNNGVGVTGVSWHSKLMAVKIFDDSGNGTEAMAINGIYYASVNGVFVENNSWGLVIPGGVQPYGDQAIWDAIVDAYQRHVLFVAAAGNDRGTYSWADRSGGFTQIFPTFPLDNIIVVAASDQYDNLASFSNYGSLVDLAAPGVSILSTVPKSIFHTYYTTMDGTSMATPHVTGVAALLKSYYPNMNFLDIKHRIVNNVDQAGDLASWKLISGGRLNAHDALTANPVPTTMNWVTAPVTSNAAGIKQTLGVYVAPTAGGTLQCDPKLYCGTGSYGKVRLWTIYSLVSVNPFLQRMGYGYQDSNLNYNSATGRYEASWDVAPASSATYQLQYIGTSVNSQSSVSTQIQVTSRASATTWVTPPTTITSGTTYTLRVNITPADGGAFNNVPSPISQVRFMDGSTVLSDVNLQTDYADNYWATLSWTPNTTGTHTLTAQYLGSTTTDSAGVTVQVVDPSSSAPIAVDVTP